MAQACKDGGWGDWVQELIFKHLGEGAVPRVVAQACERGLVGRLGPGARKSNEWEKGPCPKSWHRPAKGGSWGGWDQELAS